MENIPFESNQKGSEQKGNSPVQQSLKREVDSLDDFEHLGHDSSPLEKEQKTDSFPSTESRAGEVINKGVESAAKAVTEFTDDLDFTRHFDRSVQEEGSLVDNKMDSNLLQMGDTFSGKEQKEAKIEKFEALSSKQDEKTEEYIKEKEIGDFKSVTQNFMDMEREFIQPVMNVGGADILDRYSDSELDVEEVKASTLENKQDLIEVQSKVEANEDVQNPETPKHWLPEKEVGNIPSTAQLIELPVSTTTEPEIKKPEQTVKKEEIEIVKPTPKVEISEPKIEKPKRDVIEVEAMFCKMGLDAWFHPTKLNPKVESLIYWRDPKKTGAIFGGVLVILLALTYFSLISVVAYLSLFALTATISFRIYKNIVQAVQKTGDGHPFKEFLEYDISLPQEKVKELSEVAVSHINAAAVELRRLFLVEDLVDSIKFGVLLWCLTYLGSCFNGMTLVIIAWVALFTLPKLYEANKKQIDDNLEFVRTRLAEITASVKAAIPIGKKVEEKKDQ